MDVNRMSSFTPICLMYMQIHQSCSIFSISTFPYKWNLKNLMKNWWKRIVSILSSVLSAESTIQSPSSASRSSPAMEWGLVKVVNVFAMKTGENQTMAKMDQHQHTFAFIIDTRRDKTVFFSWLKEGSGTNLTTFRIIARSVL